MFINQKSPQMLAIANSYNPTTTTTREPDIWCSHAYWVPFFFFFFFFFLFVSHSQGGLLNLNSLHNATQFSCCCCWWVGQFFVSSSSSSLMIVMVIFSICVIVAVFEVLAVLLLLFLQVLCLCTLLSLRSRFSRRKENTAKDFLISRFSLDVW